MGKPKFHVGQKVAVCTLDLSIVIPATIINERKYLDAGISKDQDTGLISFSNAEWLYGVEGSPLSPVFHTPYLYAESAIRPLNDDDYTESDTCSLSLEG